MELRLLLLACLVGAALAGPFQRSTGSRCAQECSPSSEKFKFETGKRYVYNYKGTNYISVAGGRKQDESEITGKVEIHVVDQCEMVLQLRDVRIRNPAERDTQSIIDKLQSYPLHFSWSDGEISNICPSSSESTVSLNIKRAILSTFVNVMPDWQSFSTYKEADSLGTCDTEYSSRGEYRGTLKVHKEKSLKSCDNRHSGFDAVIAYPYQSEDSDIHSLPIFTDEVLLCDQEIKDGVIQKVVCSERAKFKPSSRHSTIADFRGVISLSLEAVRGSSGLRQPANMERKPLLYSFNQDEQVEDKEAEVRQILTELCSETRSIIYPSVSKLYYNLIKDIRYLSGESIQRIYMDLKSERLCDSPKTLDIYLDALPMAGTEGAIQLMVKLIREKEITGLKAKVWPASLALIPNPTAEAIAAVTPLLSGDEPKGPVLLGVSAMIYRICSSRDCDRLQSVRRVVNHLHSIIGDRCSSDNDEEVIEVLKAFGNMGYLGEAENSVVQCARSSGKPINIRLAAIDAFRRTQKKRPDEILHLYANPSEDYEVRIAALICAAKYPDPTVFQTVKETMEKEQHEQVAAFTKTLIKNLRRTSSPLKQDHRRLAEELEFREPDVGYWENSKNIELSAFHTPMNIGGSFESNIIHSRGSKIPRSGTARVDIDLFGKTINLVEFGLRTEGLENAFRRLLGMNEKGTKTNLKNSWFSRTLKKASPMSSESDKPEISFFLRTMDTEIFDFSSSDITSVGNMMHFADILNKLARGEASDLSHSFMFVDTQMVVPSVTGRSYALGLAGTATVGLSANGKFDAINLMSTPMNCDIEGRFQPSCNVELTATVGIHSEKTRPDVKIVTSFHTESDAEAKFFIKDGHLLQAKWNMPSEEIQLLKFGTNVYEVGPDGEDRPLLDEMRTKVDHCTKSLVKPIGIEICGKLQIPHPLVSRSFPFSKGLGNVELSLKKSDPAMEGFEVYIEVPRHKRDDMVYKAYFDTPGSSIRRKFSANLEVKPSSTGGREFQFDAESPFNSFSSSGSYEKTPSRIKGAIQVVADRSHRYSMKAIVETVSSGSEKTYNPFVQLQLPNSDPITVTGSIKHVQGRKEQLMIDLKSNKPREKPIVLTGTLMKDGSLSLSKNAEWRVTSDLVAKSPWVSMKIRGAADKQSHQPSSSISSSLTIDYQLGRSRRQTVRFSSKLQQKDTGKLSASAQFESTYIPYCNWLLSWDMQGKLREPMKNDIILRYGENPANSYIHLIQMSKPGDQSTLSEAKFLLTAPQFGVDSEFHVSGKVDFKRSNDFHVETDLRYSGEKHITSLIKLQTVSQTPLKMSLRAQMESPWKKISYTDEIEETSPNEYSGNSMVKWNEESQASLRYKYKKLSSRSTFHHEIEAVLQTPLLSAPIKHKGMLKLSPESFNFENRMKIGRKPTYFVTAAVQRRGGPCELAIRVPQLEGSLKVQNDPQIKSASLDLKGTSISRHVVATGKLSLEQKKFIECEIHFDADRNPSSKASFSSEVEITSVRSKKSYSIATELRYLDIINVKAAMKGSNGVSGPHQLMIDVAGRSIEPVVLNIEHETSSSEVHSTFTIHKRHLEKAKLELRGKVLKQTSGIEMSCGISLKSGDGSFEDKEITLSHLHSKTPSSLNSKCNWRVQLSPNKVYACQLELSHQARRSTNLQMQLSTPHRRFEMQRLQISYRRSSSRKSLEATLEYGSAQKATLASVMDTTRVGRSYSLIVTSPISFVREAKYFIAYENQVSRKQVESNFELNKKLMYDTAVSYEEQSGKVAVRSHLKSAVTPDFVATINMENNRESYKHELVVSKNERKLFSAEIAKHSSRRDFYYSFEIEDSERTLLDVKFAKELRGPSSKYRAEAKGPFTPLSATIETIRSDEKSFTLSATVCKETPNPDCFIAKGYYKNEGSTSKYRHYKKVTLDIERSRGSYSPEQVGNVHYIFADQRRSLKSKLSIDVNGQKASYDIQVNKPKSEHEPGTVDVSVSLPSRAARASVSFLRSSERHAYAIEVVPDISASSKKLFASLTSEPQRGLSNHNEISGHITVDHKVWENPVEITFGLVRSSSVWPVSAKVEVEYSKNPADKLTCEMRTEADRSQPGKYNYVYEIYSADRDFDLLVNVVKESHESSGYPVRQYGWHWIWNPQTVPRAGGLLVTLSHDPNLSTPCTTNITYYSPSTSLSLLGHTLWEENLPVESKWKYVANEEILAEAEIHRDGACYDVEITEPNPVWKSRICYEKVERAENRLTAECFYNGEKCVDVIAIFNPHLPMMSSINAHWKQEQLVLAAESAKNLSPALKDPVLEAVEAEMKEKARRIGMSVQRKVWHPLKAHLSSELSEMFERQKEKLRELVRNLREKIPSWWEELHDKYLSPYLESIKEKLREVKEYCTRNCPEELKDLWEELVKYWEKCEKKYCSRGSFCHQLRSTYRRRGMKDTRKLLMQKTIDVAKTWGQKFKEAVSRLQPYVERFWSHYDVAVQRLRRMLSSFGVQFHFWDRVVDAMHDASRKIADKLKRYYEELKQKFEEFVDKTSDNDDVKVLTQLVTEAKNEVKKQWVQTDFKKMLKPLSKAAVEAFPRRWIKEQLSIESDFKNGSFQLKMPKPLDRSKIVMLKNGLILMKNKLQQALA